MSSAAFLTLGCKLNYAETSTYRRGLVAAGWQVVDWRSKADLYIINTCTVTATSDSKSRNLVRKVGRVNPSADILVTGCSAALRPGDYSGMPGVRRVFGPGEKSRVVPFAIALHGGAAPAAEQEGPVFGAFSSGERTRSFLKVQDGCDNFCKYCTVPYARGRSRSLSVQECVGAAREIASLGMKEIVLTGVNTGDYGRGGPDGFMDLLRALNAVEGIERYRISSIEPNLLTEDTVAWIASGTKFLPHFHIPLQSGCDRILAAMGRRYDTAFFGGRLDMVRKYMEKPGGLKVFFGIDVMAGLPGETDADFAESLEFIRRIRPAFIHAFPYSRRPGTPAASMKGQVDEEVKRERVRALEELSAELNADFTEANRGLKAKVLWEACHPDGTMSGYTENYIRAYAGSNPALVGEITDYEI